jgi:hypothetical protein
VGIVPTSAFRMARLMGSDMPRKYGSGIVALGFCVVVVEGVGMVVLVVLEGVVGVIGGGGGGEAGGTGIGERPNGGIR